MSEEIFDIVDSDDRVIGTAPRAIVHRDNLLHRAAHIWIINPQGLILIQLRSAHKDLHPLTWDSSACGHLDSGEDYLTAAQRECMEELGLAHPPRLTEIAYCTDTAELGHEFVRLYLARHPGPFYPPPQEIKKIQWIVPTALTTWVQSEPSAFAPSFVHLWNKYHTRVGKICQTF